MLLKLDINLFKSFIIIVILFCLVSKIPQENIPFGNKYILIIFIMFIMILTDQKGLIKEKFVDDNIQLTKTNNHRNVLLVAPANISNIQNEEVQNKIINVITETIPKIEVVSTTNLVDLANDKKEVISTTNRVDLANYKKEEKEEKKEKEEKEEKENMGNSQLMTKDEIINKTIANTNSESCNCEDIANKAISKFLNNRRLIDNKGMLHYADAYLGDMGYSDLRYENYIPLGSQGDGVYNSWDMGQFNLINTSRWRPVIGNEGRCRKEDIPDPQPYDKGQMSLMNWDYSRKVTGPSNINTKYINEKLNQ